MIAPTLLIGLGGTGSKIVDKVSKMITDDQKQHISFCVFDTDINELREIREKNYRIKTVQTSAKKSVGEYLNIDTHARDSWFPVNSILNSKMLTEGAGQVRAISRLAFEASIREGNMQPLHEAIDDLYKVTDKSEDQALRIIIVSSLAGGTGSGLILPVALYVKHYLKNRYQQAGNICRGFFILPEVFFKVIHGTAEQNNLKCNAYATLRELDTFLMKGDGTLDDTYRNTKIEFPIVGSEDYEEYNIRPYEFCFLFDGQNVEGKTLNTFNQYLDHAANCIYSQSIGPMNKRSNSSEDNTIRELCRQLGRNRYAGAGCSVLEYPMAGVKEYVALKWTKDAISQSWTFFDNEYKNKKKEENDARSKGIITQPVEQAQYYLDQIDFHAKNKNPFALNIKQACQNFDKDGRVIGEKWFDYYNGLAKHVRYLVNSDQYLTKKYNEICEEINGITGDEEVWNKFYDAFIKMEGYKNKVDEYIDSKATTIAYTLFDGQMEGASEQDYQIEKYLKSNGKFIHPNSIRYFLYSTLKLLDQQKTNVSTECNNDSEIIEGFVSSYFDLKNKNNTKNDSASKENIRNFKVTIGNKMGKLNRKQKNMQDAFISEYLSAVENYKVNSILLKVIEEAYIKIDAIAKTYEIFYATFDKKISEIGMRLFNIEKQYETVVGQTRIFVCANKKCLEKFANDMPYTGSTINVDPELSRGIFDRVKEYTVLDPKKRPEGDKFFNGIFEEKVKEYYKRELEKYYGSRIDMNIIEALGKEAEYSEDIYDRAGINKYIKDRIDDIRQLSSPFIEKPLGESRASIPACTYNKVLENIEDPELAKIVGEKLKDHGGTPDDDISKGMIMFYDAIYGIRANSLNKFAPSNEALNRLPGEYYKAYYEVVSKISPKNETNRVVSPHIDRYWHLCNYMPDLDEESQKRQESRIYKSFFLSLALGYIRYINDNRRIYQLALTNSEPKEFVVSNQTPCDNFYEVLDALSINPIIVDEINESAKKTFEKEKLEKAQLTFETSKLYKGLMDLAVEKEGNKYVYEFKKENLTLFDISLLLKTKTPAAEFNGKRGIDVLITAFEIVYDYISSILVDSQVISTYTNFIKEQLNIFEKEFKFYFENDAEKNSADEFFEYYGEYIDESLRKVKDLVINKGCDEDTITEIFPKNFKEEIIKQK